jgi:hypothetical protein
MARCGPCAKAHPGATNLDHKKCKGCGVIRASVGLPATPKALLWCVRLGVGITVIFTPPCIPHQ